MLKTLITLVRGRTYAIAEEVADQNALLILDQQMRDATGALDTAKKALAVAIAQESQESQRLDGTRARIEDLETRAVAAIEAGRGIEHVKRRLSRLCLDLMLAQAGQRRLGFHERTRENRGTLDAASAREPDRHRRPGDPPPAIEL